MYVRSPRLVVSAVLVTITIWFLLMHPWHNSGRGGHIHREHNGDSSETESFTEQATSNSKVSHHEIWGLSNMRRSIKVSTVNVETGFLSGFVPPVTQDIGLTFDFTDIDTTDAFAIQRLPANSVTIPVPEHHTPDASSLIFAVATKLDRLRNALPAFKLWAAGANTKFVAIVEPEAPGLPTKAEIVELYRQNQIEILVEDSDADWWTRFVLLAGRVYDIMEPHHKWAVIMDDDTHFFSLKRVNEMLGKYDASLPHYVGGLSENKEHIDRVGYFAYGGAGIFLSKPLLKELRPHVGQCAAMDDPSGDIRLNTCIMNFTLTKFTPEYHLFQMDIHGDLTGFYEADRERPISTHHWNSWHHHDMPTISSVGRICGNECVLQKYQAHGGGGGGGGGAAGAAKHEGGYYLTNGFSIVKYSYTPDQLATFVPGAMEQTWADTIWTIPTSWKYTLYPLKPKDPGKIQYLIEKVDENDDAMTLYYVRRRKEEDNIGDGVVRMIWKKKPPQQEREQ